MDGEVTAAEMRARAWGALGHSSAYGTFVLGLFVQGLAITAAILILVAVFVGGVAAVTAVLQSMGVNVEQLSFPLLAGTFALSAVAVCGALYVVSFSWWGQTAMGIATVRGGLRFSHAFSGWGNGWRMTSLLLWQSTYVTLYFLLLIVPGIRACFTYALAPYLLVDHPELTPRQCLAESARLMEGHRWRLFCLGVSFTGWFILVVLLSMVVGNLAQTFFNPYPLTAFAAFYEDLLDRQDHAV